MEFEIMKEFIALTAKLMSQIETNEFTDKNGNCLQHNNDYIALMEFIEECLPE